MFSENIILSPQEITYIRTRNKRYQLAFAMLLKYYQQNYEFIEYLAGIPQIIINRIAQQLKISPKLHLPSKRTIDELYSLIRRYFKSSFKSNHTEKLSNWIKYDLQNDQSIAKLNGSLLDYKDKGISAIGWVN